MRLCVEYRLGKKKAVKGVADEIKARLVELPS
jgi:hypothetical protein